MERLRRIASISAQEVVVDVSDVVAQVGRNDLDAVLCVAPAAALDVVIVESGAWRSRLKRGGRFGIAAFGGSPGDLEACRDALREAGYGQIDVRCETATVTAGAPGPPPRVTYAIGWK